MRPRPRVLHLIGSLDIGGAERQIVEIVRGLAGRFEFHVGVLSSGGPLEPLVRAEGAKIHPLTSRGVAMSPVRRVWRAACAWSRLRSLLQDLDPDIIHAWLFEMSFLAAASRWPSRTPPLLVSRRNLVEWFARQSIYYPLARWTNRQADLLLANSEAVRADVMRKEGVGGERVALIYNGVDTDRFHPRERDAGFASALGLPADVPVIGVVANLHLYKGHLDLLDAAARLVAQGFRFALLLVGRDGPASEPVHARAAVLDVPAIWAGPRNDVERLLPLMDIVVSTSHEEGFSNSILEAMACGRAIVATSVGGTPEQIVDGHTGCLVPPRDPASLAAALAMLLEDPALRGRLGQAARQTAEQRFSLPRLHVEMERLYRDLAASGSGPS